MIKLKSPLFFILLFLSLAIFGQTPKQKIVDLTTSSVTFKKSVLLNNRIYTIGQSETAANKVPVIVKQNLNLDRLNMLYLKRHVDNNEGFFFNTIVKTSDNQLILSGSLEDDLSDPVWIVKMDTNFNYQWNIDLRTHGVQEVTDMFPNPTGGVTILATESLIGSVRTQIINIDNNGQVMWVKRVSGLLDLDHPIGYWDNSGQLRVMVVNRNKSQFIRLTAAGAPVDYREFSHIVGADTNRLILKTVTKDNNYTYYGGQGAYGSWKSILMKVDNQDQVVWAKQMPAFTVITNVNINLAGDLMVYGEDHFNDRINKAFLVKVNPNDGSVLASKAYGKLPNNHLLTSDFIEANNHYFISGSRSYQGASTGFQLVLNSDLESNSCYESNVEINNVINETFTIKTLDVNLDGNNNYNYNNLVTLNLTSSLSTGFVQDHYTLSSDIAWIDGAGNSDYELNNNITTSIEVNGDLCNSAPYGTALISAVGGDPGYTHSWSTGYVTDYVYGLLRGSVVSVITNDIYGCYTYDEITIPQRTLPQPICMITVDETSSKNIISWEKPVVNDNNISSYNIYREVAGNYGLVGNVLYDSLSQFIDVTNGVNPNITSYRYKISALDTCGGESELSDFHETIHMTVTQNSNSQPALIWDGYEGLTFQYYRIMRDSTNTDDWEAVDSVSNNVFTWTDVTPPTVPSRYMIEVVIDPCTSTKANTYGATRSNRSSGGGIIFQSLVASFSETNTLIQVGQSVVYTDNSISASGNYNRAWTFEGGFPNVGNQVSEIVTYNTPGNYYTKLEVSDSVNSDVLIKTGLIEVGISGIENISAFKSVTVYPNPTKDNLSVSIDLLKSSEVIAKLYSIEGKLIEAKRNESNSSIQFSFDLSSQSKGVYLLELNTMEGKIVRKIFKN